LFGADVLSTAAGNFFTEGTGPGSVVGPHLPVVVARAGVVEGRPWRDVVLKELRRQPQGGTKTCLHRALVWRYVGCARPNGLRSWILGGLAAGVRRGWVGDCTRTRVDAWNRTSRFSGADRRRAQGPGRVFVSAWVYGYATTLLVFTTPFFGSFARALRLGSRGKCAAITQENPPVRTPALPRYATKDRKEGAVPRATWFVVGRNRISRTLPDRAPKFRGVGGAGRVCPHSEGCLHRRGSEDGLVGRRWGRPGKTSAVHVPPTRSQLLRWRLPERPDQEDNRRGLVLEGFS